MLKTLKESSIQFMLDVLNDLFTNMRSDVFDYIYMCFKASVHYTVNCFKIVNIHYFEYINEKFEKKKELIKIMLMRYFLILLNNGMKKIYPEIRFRFY